MRNYEMIRDGKIRITKVSDGEKLETGWVNVDGEKMAQYGNYVVTPDFMKPETVELMRADMEMAMNELAKDKNIRVTMAEIICKPKSGEFPGTVGWKFRVKEIEDADS